jgi:hypothetical protein
MCVNGSPGIGGMPRGPRIEEPDLVENLKTESEILDDVCQDCPDPSAWNVLRERVLQDMRVGPLETTWASTLSTATVTNYGTYIRPFLRYMLENYE